MIRNKFLMQGAEYMWVGIRCEDKSVWERRAPLTPPDLSELQGLHPYLRFIIQPSDKRVFSNEQYRKAGIIVHEDLSKCTLIIGIKQIPIEKLLAHKTYLCFSHTIKAQADNMPTLDAMLQLRIRLIDYEKISDEKNNRLIAFGKYAGIAGTIDFLQGFGQYLVEMGVNNPFLAVSCSYKYDTAQEIRRIFQKITKKIQHAGLPQKHAPYIFALTGNGRTAQGCKQILNYLPVQWVHPDSLPTLVADKHNPKHLTTIYATNILTEHCIVPKEEGTVFNKTVFNKTDFKENPSKYQCIFAQKYLPYISVLFHCIFWDTRFERYITNDSFYKLACENRLRLLGISDITCDINGSIECLRKATTPEDPFFYYNPKTRQTVYGLHESVKTEGNILYQAVDFLPCQLAETASVDFSATLKKWIPCIAASDINKNLEEQGLLPQLTKAVITHNGRLTPTFQYILKKRKDSSQ